MNCCGYSKLLVLSVQFQIIHMIYKKQISNLSDFLNNRDKSLKARLRFGTILTKV